MPQGNKYSLVCNSLWVFSCELVFPGVPAYGLILRNVAISTVHCSEVVLSRDTDNVDTTHPKILVLDQRLHLKAGRPEACLACSAQQVLSKLIVSSLLGYSKGRNTERVACEQREDEEKHRVKR